MRVAFHRRQSQFYLIAISFGLAFCAWNIADPGRFCSSPQIWPAVTITIFLGWLLVCTLFAPRSNSWSWKHFLIASFFGGGVFAALLIFVVITGIPFYNVQPENPIRGTLAPIAMFAPYAVVSGLWGQSAIAPKEAAVAGFLVLVTQVAVDFVFAIPIICAY